MDTVEAIERCAYCRQYVPVTHLDVHPKTEETYIRARVSVCESCLGDGR